MACRCKVRDTLCASGSNQVGGFLQMHRGTCADCTHTVGKQSAIRHPPSPAASSTQRCCHPVTGMSWVVGRGSRQASEMCLSYLVLHHPPEFLANTNGPANGLAHMAG